MPTRPYFVERVRFAAICVRFYAISEDSCRAISVIANKRYYRKVVSVTNSANELRK
ncbi:hypothetical protein HMPREF3208_00713 [Gardnerella vaginalis]|uniref:Uncharacterized protein n=1 Tax=Gardnerella vaginalis TaxID=2702 RepID=A0A133NX85_GARVA|nr:hypothetical protein HMPREF3208_00713 [Gardnerella vaginalis]